jgi:hypothetical protein
MWQTVGTFCVAFETRQKKANTRSNMTQMNIFYVMSSNLFTIFNLLLLRSLSPLCATSIYINSNNKNTMPTILNLKCELCYSIPYTKNSIAMVIITVEY